MGIDYWKWLFYGFSPIIIQEYANLDARIKLIHNDINKSLPASLNIGFDSARGEYYTWTSDDNYYLPQAIEEMVNYLDNHGDEPMVVEKMKDSLDVLCMLYYEFLEAGYRECCCAPLSLTYN